MAQTAAPTPARSPEELASLKRDLLVKVFAAILVAVGVAVDLLLPPIQNPQVAQVESQLQRPIVDVVIAVVMLFIAGWTARIPAALGVVLLLFGSVQYWLYNAETADARGVLAGSAGWTSEPIAPTAGGTARNTTDKWGYASAQWSGSSYSLDLHSTTGTTQQGYNLNAGSLDSRYVFSAQVVEKQGIITSTCPLLFGVKDIRNYYTFRIEQGSGGTYTAAVYQIVANPGENSGFTADTIDQSAPLPYVHHWDVMQPWAGDDTTLMIAADGDDYRFFVNGRQVFHRPIDTLPPHMVAVGLTTIGIDNPADTICSFDHVNLRVDAP